MHRATRRNPTLGLLLLLASAPGLAFGQVEAGTLVGSSSDTLAQPTSGGRSNTDGIANPSTAGVLQEPVSTAVHGDLGAGVYRDPGAQSMSPEIRAGFALRHPSQYGVVPADFDGDRRADLSLVLDGGTWQIDYSGNGLGAWDETLRGYAGGDTEPVPADYDGDGRADLAIKNHVSGIWSIDYAGDGFHGYEDHVPGWYTHDHRAVPADYNGLGMVDLAVQDRIRGIWYIDYAEDGWDGGGKDLVVVEHGTATADPAPADYDGDGKADIAVKDLDGVWSIDFSRGGLRARGFDRAFAGYGGPNAHAVPADYDDDGYADLAVKADTGTWYIDYAYDDFGAWDAMVGDAGGTTARAVPADHDGDGRADLAVREDCGAWFVDHSSNDFGPWDLRFDHVAPNGFATVSDVSDLVDTLASDFQGTVHVPLLAQDLTLTSHRFLAVKSCVTIAGTRRGLDPGTRLYTGDQSSSHSLFELIGHDIRIQGLRFAGPENGTRSSTQPPVSALSITVDPLRGKGANIVVDNNDMSLWTHSAVLIHGQIPDVNVGQVPPHAPRMSRFDAGLIRVTRNSLHHNSREGRGYGVSVNRGAHATIEGNVFSHNRHAVASDGAPYTGYVARYNYVLEGGYTVDGYWNQHFDVHGTGDGGYEGTGGEYYDIAHNTIRGEQRYGLGYATRPALMVRGTATEGVYFHDNVLVHDDERAAVSRKDSSEIDFEQAIGNVHVHGNAYDTDPSLDLVAGDFDGDGRDDVLLANGTAWWYSSKGLTEWQFLRASKVRAADLRVGQFDPATLARDVFWQEHGAWWISSGGVGDPQRLRVESLPLADLVFGDFDGDGRTDVLHTDGTSWRVSWQARQPLEWRNGSAYRASSLRVGRFDADASDDVMTVANDQWSVSYGAGTKWMRLAPKYSSGVSGLVVGDFNGDGLDDLAKTSGDEWLCWVNGQSGWLLLRSDVIEQAVDDIRDAVLGRFDGDGAVDAVRFALVEVNQAASAPIWTPGTRFAHWTLPQNAFAHWTSAYMR